MRKIVEFNTKWAFSKEAVTCPNEMPKNWVWVNLPHTWNNIDGIDDTNNELLIKKNNNKVFVLPFRNSNPLKYVIALKKIIKEKNIREEGFIKTLKNLLLKI